MSLTEILDRVETEHTRRQFVLGYVRYEALRTCNPREYAELVRRNLAGENFDELVDALVIENSKL